MKKCKLLCLFLAVVLVLPVFAGCTSGKVSATVSLKFVIPAEEEGGEDDVRLDLPSLTVEGTRDNPPTVLQAAEQALQEYEITYELTSDGASIAGVFGLKEEQWYDEENGYFTQWRCTINGENSDEGRQSVTKIYNDDEIVYTWVSDSRPIESTGAVETTDPSDTTGEMPSNTTAEENA